MAGVRSKWLHQVREVISLESFREWFEKLETLRKSVALSKNHYEELLSQVNMAEFRSELAQKNAIDTLYRASEYEDDAARMEAESTDLENNAMENLGGFENQRVKTSDLWFKLEASEHDLEQAKKNKDQGKLSELSLTVRRTREEYEREASRKQRMWEEVEAMWANALEKSLLLREKRMKGRSVRKTAEKLFVEAEKQKAKALQTKEDVQNAAKKQDTVERELSDHVTQAINLFSAVVLEDFMYWQQRENDEAVWVVPLISDSGNYNMDFHACTLLQCDRNKGVEFLEPLVEQVVKDEHDLQSDRRLDDFFGVQASEIGVTNNGEG